MTEEIKEVLDNLVINDTTGMCYLSIRLTNQTRNIITNLQQENEKLKYNARGQVNDYFKDKYADEVLKNAELKKENEKLNQNNQSYQEEMARTWEIADDYKSRCNKAIEYINEHTLFVNGGIIKNILNGSDENE